MSPTVVECQTSVLWSRCAELALPILAQEPDAQLRLHRRLLRCCADLTCELSSQLLAEIMAAPLWLPRRCLHQTSSERRLFEESYPLALGVITGIQLEPCCELCLPVTCLVIMFRMESCRTHTPVSHVKLAVHNHVKDELGDIVDVLARSVS